MLLLLFLLDETFGFVIKFAFRFSLDRCECLPIILSIHILLAREDLTMIHSRIPS